MTAKKQGQFQTINQGLQALVEAVESKLKLTKIYKGTKVTQIEKAEGGYGVQLDSGQTLLQILPL